MKKAVRELAREYDQSLQIAGGSYWKIGGARTPRSFFLHLPKIFPYGMTLLLEGLEMGLTARSLYQEFPAVYTRRVACDTISPAPEAFHVAFSGEFADRLCQLIDSQGLDAAFYHIKGYSKREILFAFHDAFQGDLILSNCLPHAAVQELACALGCSVERAKFRVDHREYMKAIDRAMNPSWWRRLFRLFERGKGP